MILETDRLILRNYKDTDWERVHLYGSLSDFSQYDIWGPNTIDDTKNFISASIKKSEKSPRYEFEFAIILKENSLLIGGCGIRRDWERGSVANLGYAINPDFQSKGYATEAAKALISFGFNKLNLCVIYATCDTRNTASYKIMEKLGMKEVGHVKNHKKIRGHMRDSYCYEILRN
jgi:[ribosomal protein S5]-alanine N-acetyltransferase